MKIQHKILGRLLASAIAGLGMVHMAQADYPATVLADQPAGYWRLDDVPSLLPDISVLNKGSAGTSADGIFTGYVGREEDGALNGSTDKAMRFWGNIAEVSRVLMGGKENFNFTGTTAFTLEAWVKPMIGLTSSSGTQRLISNGSGQNGYGFGMQNHNTLRITGHSVADVTSDAMATPFASNQWYHVAMVRSNTSVYFYVNGTQLGNPKTLSNVKNSTNALAIGRSPQGAGGEGFTGVIDEPAVYPAALPAERIAAHYQAGLNNGAGYEATILADAPVGYWRLNEPKRVESTSVIANLGSLGAAANGNVFGTPGSLESGVAGAVAGDANPAMNFAGTDAHIDVPHLAGLNTPSYSVECWVRLNSYTGTASPITSRQSITGTEASGYILYAYPVSNQPRWEFWNGNGSAWGAANAGAADGVLNKWTHLVATYDAATKQSLLYVDGKVSRGLTNAPQMLNRTTPLRIGAGSSELLFGQYFFNGAIDEVAVYPAALSPQRVQAHYEAATGTAPAVSGPGLAFQPSGQTNWAPHTINVSCVVTGSLPMALQWYRVGTDGVTVTPVAGATNMVLTLSSTSQTMNGEYYVTASNAGGSVDSSRAYVELIPQAAPQVTLDVPSETPVYTGGTAGIPLIVTNTPPFAYQWQSNSVNIPDGTNQVLAIRNVQSSYGSAVYQARITNPAGNVTSASGSISVKTAPASTYAAVMTAMNPLAFWRFGEVSGNVAFDYWGGKPAYFFNAMQGASGALLQDDDGAFATMGSGSYARTIESAPFNFTGVQPFTLAAWVRADQFPTGGRARLFSTRQQTGVSGGYGLGFLNNNTLRFTGYGVADADASVPSFAVGEWYHIAAVRSNTTVYLYINGALANSGNVANIRSSSQSLQFGGNPNFVAATDEEPFSGTIDDAAVFDRALTSLEVSALYSARQGALNPPFITQEPVSAKVYVGGTARFAVKADGSAPLAYQWFTNGVALTGATDMSLVVTGVTLAQNNWNYSVRVSNQAGFQVSGNALLTVEQPSGYVNAVLTDNPVALWRLNESTGPVVHDSWGGFNGVDSGTIMYGTAGAPANTTDTAATFDGYSSKVEVPFASALNPAVFSLECWVRVTGGEGTYRTAISTRDELATGWQKGFIIYATAQNRWSFWTSTGGADAGFQTLDGPQVVLNEWTHLIAVFDGSVKYFYVNGELAGTSAITADPNIIRPLRIGAGKNESDTAMYFFNGDIDEVALYNKALTPERVDYHYSLGKYSDTTAPFMVHQPESLDLIVGVAASFNAQAAGSPTLAYQWLHNGQPVTGATEHSLSLSNTTFADAGDYALRVANSLNTITSQVATLNLGAQPTFANLTNNLVVHLKFENNVQDASGRNNHGTIAGAPTFVSGRIGQALHYKTAGSSYNYVTLGTPADLQFGESTDFTVSYWVRFTSATNLPFLANTLLPYGDTGLSFTAGEGNFAWSIKGAGGAAQTGFATEPINNGAWHHLVHTFDRSGNAVTYLDGQEVDSRAISSVGNLDAANAFNIGQDGTGALAVDAEADIDDLGIWNRALTSYEAYSIYAAASVSGQSFDVVGPVYLQLVPSTSGIELIWQSGTLVESTSLTGTYTPVPEAKAPYHKITPGAGAKFYRIKL